MRQTKKRALLPLLRGAGPHHLAAELRVRLPQAQVALLERIAVEAGRQDLYLVGGPVRDLLLGQRSLDFDLVLEGEAIPLARRLAKALGGKVTVHARFGTAVWGLDHARDEIAGKLSSGDAKHLPASVDLISARQEIYPEPGALPKVEFATIKEDTGRRDFTLNTLALRLDGEHFGELVDLWGGLADLSARHLRVLHAKSFEDDPTRILRILRFAGRFGFEIEPDTLKWLKAGLSYLEQVSGKRIRTELDYVLKEEQCVAILEQMETLEVLKAIHPALQFDEEAAETLKNLDKGGAKLGMLAWLLHVEEAGAVAQRLRLEGNLVKAILAAQDLLPDLPLLAAGKPSAAVARLEKAPALARSALKLASKSVKVREMLERYEESWQNVSPKTDGHTLQARGMKPGPRYKEILWRLRAAWLDGEVSSQAEEETLLEELIDGAA